MPEPAPPPRSGPFAHRHQAWAVGLLLALIVLEHFAGLRLMAWLWPWLLPLLALGTGFKLLLWGHGYGLLPGRPSLTLALAFGWGIYGLLMLGLCALGRWTGLRLTGPLLPFALLLLWLLLPGCPRGLLEREISLRWARLLRAARSRGPLPRFGPALLLAALVMAAALQLASAYAPSFLYDVLEYHLPMARQAGLEGRLGALEGNRYSLMPKAAEAVYGLAGIFAEGDIERGAKLAHVCFGFTAAALVLALARAWGLGLGLSLLATWLFLAHPLVYKLSMDAFVGLGTAMHCAAAWLCWTRWRRHRARADLLLAGGFLGFALSMKYPVLGIAVLPFLVVLALDPRSGPGPRARLAALGWVLSGLALTWGPWMLRGLALGGSPFPPLTGRWWGAAHPADAALRDFMSGAHGPRSPLSADYWLGLADRWREAGPLLAASVLALLVLPRAGRARLPALAALLGYLVWKLPDHAPDRFLAPLLPLGCLAAALLLRYCAERLPRLGLLVALPFLLLSGWHFAGQALDSRQLGFFQRWDRADFLEARLGLTGRFFRAIGDHARPGEGVLLLYEARRAALPHDMDLRCNTVFDRAPLWELLGHPEADDPARVAALLGEAGIGLVALNELELARLLATYPAAPARRDPAFQAMRQALPRPYHPGMRNYIRYYPPYWYEDPDERPPRLARLQGFLDWLAPRALWRSDHQGLALWVARLPAAARSQ